MKTKLFKQTIKLTKILTLLVVVVFSFTIISCEESEDLTPLDENADLINEDYASEIFDEVADLGDEAVDYLDNSTTKSSSEIETLGNYYRLSPCATITREYRNDSVLVTIDFGEQNCLCNDGRERRGKIHMNHYGFYWGDGEADIEFYFENYYVDNNQLIGVRNVHRYTNQNQHRQSDILTEGSVILAEDAGTITWSAERTREVIEGSETHYKYDDVIQITGSSSATLADGTEITSEITTPLVRIYELGCFRYFVSGVRTISKGDEEIIIDYGDGSCDNIAEMTRDGETYQYEIRRRQRFSW